MVESGEIGVGDLITFILYMIFIGGSITGLGDMYGQVQKTIGATERIREILDEDAEHDPEIKKGIVPAKIQGKIQYQQVNFTYPTRTDVQVLNGIQFEVSPGQKVALAGSSGAGKSTIVQLLMRLYDVSDGAILVDGTNIREYDVNGLRQHIGIVPQEVILFGGTIRENIAYGRPGASLSEIELAARKANAWDFISKFPEGLETVVGERGVKLSGGQRQRIAIARAILKDPAILILDEATSSLDAESERLVQEALDVLMEGRTTLIIAHRLATIRNVDRIYVLDNGQIAEQGTHEELVREPDGIYQRLVKLQMSALEESSSLLD
jgi:ABC-type multidrug transport system fused ATPase/permease subunit